MSPMGIWCNESQERYVLAISDKKIKQFEDLVNAKSHTLELANWIEELKN